MPSKYLWEFDVIYNYIYRNRYILLSIWAYLSSCIKQGYQSPKLFSLLKENEKIKETKEKISLLIIQLDIFLVKMLLQMTKFIMLNTIIRQH